MSDLAHGLWALALLLAVFMASRVAVASLAVKKRRLELTEERRKQVEQLTKRFDDVQAIANTLKADWLSLKMARK